MGKHPLAPFVLNLIILGPTSSESSLMTCSRENKSHESYHFEVKPPGTRVYLDHVVTYARAEDRDRTEIPEAQTGGRVLPMTAAVSTSF